MTLRPLVPGAYSNVFRSNDAAILPRLARRAAIVAIVSEYSMTQLDRFSIVRTDNVHVVHNGADHVLRIAADPVPLSRHR